MPNHKEHFNIRKKNNTAEKFFEFYCARNNITCARYGMDQLNSGITGKEFKGIKGELQRSNTYQGFWDRPGRGLPTYTEFDERVFLYLKTGCLPLENSVKNNGITSTFILAASFGVTIIIAGALILKNSSVCSTSSPKHVLPIPSTYVKMSM